MKYHPCIATISCTYSTERETKSLVVLTLHYALFLCVDYLMQEVKILTQAHQKKENKPSVQPLKKALSFGIHFLCNNSTAHALLTFRAHCKTQLFI